MGFKWVKLASSPYSSRKFGDTILTKINPIADSPLMKNLVPIPALKNQDEASLTSQLFTASCLPVSRDIAL